MTERNPERLPPEWLPQPVARPPGDGDDEAPWEARLQRLLRAAEPKLAELARTAASEAAARPAAAPPWWALIGRRWLPTLASAVGAAAVLVLAIRLTPLPARTPSSAAFTLTTVAGQGEAASLWQGLGATADPVLAQVVLHGDTR